jgi:tetratricopeptide (TPR) repeat protein
LLRRAQDLDPDLWEVSYLLGVAEAAAGRPQRAIAAYRSVLAQNDRVAEAHNNLAWLLADRELDPVLAEVHARRAAELQPENPHILGTLGWAQYKNRMLDEAAVTLWSATRLLPDDPMKHYMLGVVQLDRGLKREARLEIERALEIDPQFERAADAGELLEELGG